MNPLSKPPRPSPWPLIFVIVAIGIMVATMFCGQKSGAADVNINVLYESISKKQINYLEVGSSGSSYYIKGQFKLDEKEGGPLHCKSFSLNVVSGENIEKAALENTVPLFYKTESGFWKFFWSILPILFFSLIFIFIFRSMTKSMTSQANDL